MRNNESLLQNKGTPQRKWNNSTDLQHSQHKKKDKIAVCFNIIKNKKLVLFFSYISVGNEFFITPQGMKIL